MGDVTSAPAAGQVRLVMAQGGGSLGAMNEATLGLPREVSDAFQATLPVDVLIGLGRSPARAPRQAVTRLIPPNILCATGQG
jgi:hypothetical protein